jgi:O-acetyl-ADP-ribose deacetylase (regulator of RNase III)
MVRAARIALTEIQKFLETDSQIERIYLVCFGSRAYHIYRDALDEITSRQ